MAEYTYPVEWQSGWELQYIAGKIYNLFDTSPVGGLFDGGMSSDGYNITLYFQRDLTEAEEASLNLLMAEPDIGAFPDMTGKVVIEMPNFLENWKALETALGLDVAFVGINPNNGKVFILLNEVPNTAKKTAFFNKVKELFSITRDGLSV